MNTETRKKHRIVNPEKWIGRKVTHLANYLRYQWDGEFFVCEWTGKLCRCEDDAYYGDFFEDLEQAEAAGYDPCYGWSYEGLMQMHEKSLAMRKLAQA